METEEGLLVALMTLFDTEGSRTLSQKEWSEGSAAMDLANSDGEWAILLKRFSSDDDGAPDRISFKNRIDLSGGIKPVEPFLEECAATRTCVVKTDTA